MSVHIFSDSTIDLTARQKEELNITTMPLSIHFGEESFRQDIDITIEEFYARLRKAKTLPTTSQVNPEACTQVFDSVLQEGDEAVVLTISSALSGTYQSISLAAREYTRAKVYVIDTLEVSVATMLFAYKAAQMRDAGESGQAIAQAMQQLRSRVTLYAIIDDLKYLYMGGRLSATGAKVGGVLRLKPIITLSDGSVKLISITRGMKRAYEWIGAQVKKDGLDTSFPIVFGHTDSPALMDELKPSVIENTYQGTVWHRAIGAVIGTHAGPGAVAVAFVKKA